MTSKTKIRRTECRHLVAVALTLSNHDDVAGKILVLSSDSFKSFFGLTV